MARPLPPATADLLRRLQRVGHYLDHVADTSLSDEKHEAARDHANTVWHAVERLEDFAGLIEEMAPMLRAASRVES